MSLETSRKKVYHRPASAQSYLSFDMAYAGDWGMRSEESIALPILTKLRPSGDFNWYAESTAVNDPATEVICSGNPIMMGAATANRIGILKNDAKPGEYATVITRGRVRLQLDYAGDTNRIASSTSGLEGKYAYYIRETGTVSDQAPDGTNWYGFKIGTFSGPVQLKQIAGGPGLWWADINLEPIHSETAVAIPSAGTTTNAAKLYANAVIASGLDVDVTFEVDAESSDPNNPILNKHVSWTIDSVAYPNAGKKVTHAFAAAGTGKTVQVVITDDNAVTVTKNYTLTVAAGVAPSAWTEV